MGARLTAGACLSSFIAALRDEHFALHAVWVTEEDAPYFAEVGDDAVACTSVHEPAIKCWRMLLATPPASVDSAPILWRLQ